MNYLVTNVITSTSSVKNALEKLNLLSSKSNLTLFVVDEEQHLKGTLTDGDIRRGLLDGKTIDDNVQQFMNAKFRYLKIGEFSVEDVDYFRKLEISLVPVLDKNNKIFRIVDFSKLKSILPLDVLIMAGGEGRRLKPLTNTIPKPLLPVGNKPILEHNIDRLASFGVDSFFLSVKYLSDKIEGYFKNGSQKGVKINYLFEDQPLGTIGALGLLEKNEHDTLLIVNSDILTNIDFEDFYKDFVSKNADMAVATIPYTVNIPYAVLETNHETVLSLKEKPSFTFQSNAGIYLLKKEMAQLIPPNTFYNATDLMEEVIRLGKKLIYYPLHCYWLDIGKHEDYEKAQEDIKHIKL